MKFYGELWTGEFDLYTFCIDQSSPLAWHKMNFINLCGTRMRIAHEPKRQQQAIKISETVTMQNKQSMRNKSFRLMPELLPHS